MNPVVYCPACSQPLAITQDKTMGPLTIAVVCATCKIGNRRQIQGNPHDEWTTLLTEFSKAVIENVLTGAFAKAQAQRAAEAAVKAEHERVRLLNKQRDEEELKRRMSAWNPADESYPPDPDDADGIEEAVDPLANLKAAYKKVGSAVQMAQKTLTVNSAELKDSLGNVVYQKKFAPVHLVAGDTLEITHTLEIK